MNNFRDVVEQDFCIDAECDTQEDLDFVNTDMLDFMQVTD